MLVLNSMNAMKAPTDIWPTDTYFTAQWTLFSNGEAVRFVHVPAGATATRRAGRSGGHDEPAILLSRPNGVPYSDRAVVKEFFDSFTLADDGTGLIVTTVVSDPAFLTQECVISSQFKKEADTSNWKRTRTITPSAAPLSRIRAGGAGRSRAYRADAAGSTNSTRTASGSIANTNRPNAR